jgi:dicarboxylate/amino acid:cation (Na+ or H+) symporter, DAACS family
MPWRLWWPRRWPRPDGALLVAMILFVGGVLLVMALHLGGTLSLLLRLFSRRSPRAFFRAIRLILATAFSTSSSNATLPTSIQVSRNLLGVSRATAGFVLPLGATLNMSGTALYEGCVVLFVAQVYDVQLALGQQIQLVLLAVLSAVAVAGVPGASLPVLMGLLVNFGLPAEGVLLDPGFRSRARHGAHHRERRGRRRDRLHRRRSSAGIRR